jgi:hypothetical protein
MNAIFQSLDVLLGAAWANGLPYGRPVPLLFSRALMDLQCQQRENPSRNPRLDAFKSGGLARLPIARRPPTMICDQKRVRHTPPHNLADSLCRPVWNEAKESGARGQESGVRGQESVNELVSGRVSGAESGYFPATTVVLIVENPAAYSPRARSRVAVARRQAVGWELRAGEGRA